MEKSYNAGRKRGVYDASGQDLERDCPLFPDWLNKNYEETGKKLIFHDNQSSSP